MNRGRSAATNRRQHGTASALLAGLLMLGACAPDLGALPKPLPPDAYQSGRSFAGPAADWPQTDWWRQFDDPELTRLIEDALSGAPDLRIAEARLRAAQATAQQAGAAQWPQASADASAQPTKQSVNNGFPDFIKPLLPHSWHTQSRAVLNLDYDLDLFGKNRAALAAATSEAEAARIDVAAARLTLSTAIASAYADLVRLTADQATARQALDVRSQSAKLVEGRFRNGLEDNGQLAQARAEVAIAQGQQDAIAAQIASSRHQIAALLGKGPDRALSIRPSDVVPPRAIGLPPTLPADLVGRRPDIVAARLRVEAAASRIEVARTDYYPNVDLSAAIGLQSLNPSNFLEHGSIFGAVGPAIHLPLFTGGRIEGQYRGARAGYDEAVARYDKTVANAFKDVADAVADRRALTAQLRDARAAVRESEKAWNIAKLRYNGGLSRYLDVLTAENTLVTQRRQLADLQAQSFIQTVALVRALGGGFTAPPDALANGRE